MTAVLEVAEATKTCTDCSETLDLSAFYRNVNMPDGYLKQCKPCWRVRVRPGTRQRAQGLRDRAAAIKLARGCADCGYNAHPRALEFDHLPGTDKVAGIAYMTGTGQPWARIEAEIAKCEVVCANCHAIRTAERRIVNA